VRGRGGGGDEGGGGLKGGCGGGGGDGGEVAVAVEVMELGEGQRWKRKRLVEVKGVVDGMKGVSHLLELKLRHIFVHLTVVLGHNEPPID
jgi:hypothetical protein